MDKMKNTTVMTREEAIYVVEEYRNVISKVENTEYTVEALDVALTALRGPTREMLERMFSGCEVCKNAKYVTGSVSAVAPYDDQHETETYAEGDFDFCPNCGRPLTDEAMDIMLRRWKEILYEET